MPKTGKVLWIRRSQFFQALGRLDLLKFRKTNGLTTNVSETFSQKTGAATKYSTSPSMNDSIEKTAFFSNQLSGNCEESFTTLSGTTSVRTTHGPIVFSVSKLRASEKIRRTLDSV